MAGIQVRKVMSQIARMIGRPDGCALTDAQLLEGFAVRREEACFEVLVWRHGSLVLNLCRRILRDAHEAEDAFQATFLILARKAGAIGKKESLAGWLHKVAFRVALGLQAKRTKRRAKEEPIGDPAAEQTTEDLALRDLRPIVDAELNRLPNKLRVPLVLCYLEGHTNEEAAEQLGCPKGTLLSRLARGRERLRGRLVRRGVTLSAVMLVTALSKDAMAALPTALAGTTAKAATAFAAGQAAGLVSVSAASLSKTALQAMFLAKLKVASAVLATVVLVPIAGLVAHKIATREDAVPAIQPAIAQETEKPVDIAPVRERVRTEPAVAGNVVAVAADGAAMTIQIPPSVRGVPPKTVAVRLAPQTEVLFSRVGPNGARPTEGYAAQVWWADGSKDVASKVLLLGNASDRQWQPEPTVEMVVGRVVAPAPRGQGVILEVPARGQSVVKKEIRFNEKTVVVYNNVRPGGATPTEGYSAQVWLAAGSTDTADRVFMKVE